jgi:hypothetical protein
LTCFVAFAEFSSVVNINFVATGTVLLVEGEFGMEVVDIRVPYGS